MRKLLVCILPVVLFAAPPKSLPVSIQIAKVTSAPDTKLYSYSASLEADHSAALAFERSGVVAQVNQKDYSYVEQGQSILKLNSEVIEAQFKSARAQLKLAKIEFARVDRLFLSKAVSASDFDNAKSKLQIAKANYDMLRAQLNQTILRAPFSGFISEVSKGVGEYVTAGSTITKINALGSYHAVFYMPQEQIALLNKFTKVTVVVGDKIYSATNILKDSLADENTRLVKVRANFKAKQLTPGIYVRANVAFSNGKTQVMVPETAVLYDDQGSHVYKMLANKPVKTMVTVGAIQNGKIVITKGLRVSDKIVSVGQFKLFPNAPITIVN